MSNYQGAGFYSVKYTDGGMDFTNDGAVWIESEERFADLMYNAGLVGNDFRIPYAVFLGNPSDALEAIINGLHVLEDCCCEAAPHYTDFHLKREELHEILDSLLVVVGHSDVEELAGPTFDALHLAEACADLPYYSVLADVADLAERVFCQANFIESVSEYQERS